MRKTRLIVALVVLALARPAFAHDPESIAVAKLHTVCATASLPDQDCAIAEAAVHDAFEGSERTGGGVSYQDVRNENEPEHADPEIAVGSFYFFSRIMEIDVGQVVTFRNTSPAGGNPHIVSSSDWAAPDHALPVPGPLSWGGGAITSGRLEPGETWDWPMEVGSHPDSGISLGIDKVLIPYHCNLHGASQMNGFLILRTRGY
ncbi:MAG: hypothetical protein ABR548_09410 [Actinomycetota bacterium]